MNIGKFIDEEKNFDLQHYLQGLYMEFELRKIINNSVFEKWNRFSPLY